MVAVALAAACASPPDPGQWGKFRYLGQVPGARPLEVIPPTSDRSGNLYVAYGGPDTTNVAVFVGKAGGGWAAGCTNTKGDRFGLHGWVGHDQDRAWYWAGDALVAVTGQSGGCDRVLDIDPATSASLAFRAVIPHVRVTPSRTTAIAFIQSPTDAVPFQVVVDLNNGIYTNAIAFTPSNAKDIRVLGVGADTANDLGVVLVHYTQNGTAHDEARFLDETAATVAIARVSGMPDTPEYGVSGYLQADDAGLFAGLLASGELVRFDQSRGSTVAIKKMAAVGVHRWDGGLWLVGTAANRPVVAAIGDSGGIGATVAWNASTTAAAGLRGDVTVVDDRKLPSKQVIWKSPTTAMGAFPFLSAHSPDPYATGTTVWLVAGAEFSFGGEPRTAIAIAPVGLKYP